MSAKPIRLSILLGALALTACVNVTINVYFPAAEAAKAADRIIDEVLQRAPQGGAEKPASSPKPAGQ